ncbi:Centrosomal protein of 95 kDa [Polyrhizophydium stewartii]|uniref:Centrosomal protein of 95 kDa n=1 Tax=Polyrhizophydium stewartii TaxID=2732419 RepID=A0ABR4NHU7_9FUNG
MNVTEHEKANAVSKINKLLVRIRLPFTILSLEEGIPTLWVALLESILESRLQGVMREPDLSGGADASHGYRLHNARAVLWALEHEILQQELPHLTAENIVRADPRTLVDLASIMWEVAYAIDSHRDEPRAFQMGDELDNSLLDVSSIASADSFSVTSDGAEQVDTPVPGPTIERLATPPPLRIHPDDTPHIRALKKRRAAMLRQEHAASFADQRRTLQDMQHQHRRTVRPDVDPLPSSFSSPPRPTKASVARSHVGVRGTRDYREPPPEHDDGDELDELLGVHSDADSDGGESDASHSLRHRAKKSRPNSSSQSRAGEHTTLAERNLDAFTKRVRREVPIVHTKFPSAAETDRVWRQQLNTWTHALEDRLWTQKVVMAARRAQTTAAQRAKAQLNEQARRIKRMENRQKSVEEDVRRIAEQRRAKEEAMLRGLLDEYVAAQRAAILDERRLERDERRALDEGRKLKEVSQRALYPLPDLDSVLLGCLALRLCKAIEMLKEKLERVKEQERIAERAHAAEMRRLVREQKEYSKERVQQIKDKLQHDWGDVHLLEEGGAQLRGSIGFRVVGPRDKR